MYVVLIILFVIISGVVALFAYLKSEDAREKGKARKGYYGYSSPWDWLLYVAFLIFVFLIFILFNPQSMGM